MTGVQTCALPIYWNWDTIGKRNEGCLDRMKRGVPSECIEKITYEQVEVLVDKMLKDEKI